MMGKAAHPSLSGFPDQPGNKQLPRDLAAQISYSGAAKNTKLPPPPHLLIRPNHVTEFGCLCQRSALSPTLQPVRQSYKALKYHGCSNCRKYSKKVFLWHTDNLLC